MADMNYLCKDCKHSTRSWTDTLFMSGEYGYKCSLAFKPAYVVNNPVIGPEKVKGEFKTCSSARTIGSECGPWAKLWQPKRKKDLFKYLTKEHGNAD